MNTFILFGTEHLTTIGVGFVACLFLIILGSFLHDGVFPRIIALIILVIKITELVFRHDFYGERVVNLLPLHLCNLSLVLAILMMLFNSKIIFQPVFFWSLGALFAIITPEIRDGIQNYATLSFFITHFFILFATLYGLIVFKFRPTKLGAIGSFIFLNIVAIALFFVNKRLGTNYLYVNAAPSTSSPIDFFGPWPFYIIVVEIIYIILSSILYYPFRNKRMRYMR